MPHNFQAAKIQSWWRNSITQCTKCEICIPKDKSPYNFNKCTICYHDKHEDYCIKCINGEKHNWNSLLLKKYEHIWI